MASFTFRCKKCGSDYDEQSIALTCCSNSFNVETYDDNGSSSIDGTNNELRLSNFKLEDEYYARLFIKFAKGCRDSDKMRDIEHEFTLTFIQFKSMMNRKTCYYTGEPLNHDYDANRAVRGEEDIVLVKKDNSLGYNKNNMVACSNKMKNFVNYLRNKVDSDSINGFVKAIDIFTKDLKECDAD